jgi:glucose-1-phosphate adenylyltransferase
LEEILVLSGDHIYKMNYEKMVQFHRQAEAAATVATIQVPIHEAHRFGVVAADADHRIVGFEEKPAEPRPDPHHPESAMVSMGVYVFNLEVLRDALVEDAEMNSSHDFGKDIIPGLIDKALVYAYPFEDENKKESKYWRDVGTIDSYWEANMDLARVDPQFNLYDKSWPMQIKLPSYPPAKFVFANRDERFGVAMDSIVSPGCIISGGQVIRSVLSPEVRVNSYSQVEESVLFRGVDVGRHARLRRVIVEKDVRIPAFAEIGYDLERDARLFRVTPSGVVVVESSDAIHVAAAR